MTRVQQWWRRRRRYIIRHGRLTNAKTRERVVDGTSHYFERGGHQSPLGVINFGKQTPPRVHYKTYKKQRPHVADQTGGHYLRFDAGGRAIPPHWRITVQLYPNDEWHGKEQLGPGPNRAVDAISRPRGRMADRDVMSFKAWTYWKYRRLWPSWDPKHRTPVDPQTASPDDDWRPE